LQYEELARKNVEVNTLSDINNDLTLNGIGTLITMLGTAGDVTDGGIMGVDVPSGDTAPSMFIAGTVDPGIELVINGGFEATTDWTNLTRTSAQAHGGTYSATTDASTSTTQAINITAGVTYVYSFWYMESGKAGAAQRFFFDWYTGTGGGGSIIKSDGVTVNLDTSFTNYTGNLRAPINAQSVIVRIFWGGAGTDYFDDISLSVAQETSYLYFRPAPTVFSGALDFQESSAPIAPVSGYLSLYSGTSNALRALNDFAQDDMLLRGEPAAAFSVAVNVTSGSPVTLASRTIAANAMGINGKHTTRVYVHILNNSGGTRTYSLQYNFSSYSITVTASATVGASATNYSIFELEVATWNDAAANAQRHHGRFRRLTAGAADTPAAWTENLTWWGASSIDTTGSVTVTAKAYSSNASATQTAKGVAEFEGPYYGA
jgi:hypothetical protein